jgi:hypothetical protein
MRTLSLILLLPLLLLAACDSLPESGAVGEVVVEAFLVAGEPLPDVTLRRSVPIGGERNTGIRDAQVRIELLREDGSVEAHCAYGYNIEGRYNCRQGSSNAMISVLPLRRYRLVAEVPGTGTVRSETLVPGDFRLLRASADTLRYQGPEQFTFTITRPAYPGRNAIFVFTTETLLRPLTLGDATPFVRGFFDRDGDGQIDHDHSGNFTLEDLRIGSSPLLNEANYERNGDGTLTIRLPWIAVAFYGPNRLSVNAVDDNLNDFLRSANVQQGGGTSSPGEILNILDHVENGTGVFGSYARVSRDVFVAR